jgi:hypothetical protein
MINRETIQTLLDLLNPLHGSLDNQTYDENRMADFNLPDDYEHDVIVTNKEERDLTQAVMILELRQSTVPTVAPVPIKALEHIRLHLLNEYQMDLYKAKFPELEAALEAVGKGTE